MEHTPNDTVAFRTFLSFDEILSRPRFRVDVPTEDARPHSILGSYRFSEPVRCGVQGCDQTHEHGFVVLIDDNTETNIGWACGMDHFGVAFMSLRQRYERSEREFPHRAILRGLINRDGEHLRARVETSQQRSYGGNWLLHNLRRFAELYPVELQEALWRHAEQGEVDVFQTIGTGSPPFAKVEGLRIFRFDTDRWPLLETETEVEEFLQLNAEQLSIEDVITWNEWAQTLEAKLATLDSLIDEGKKFFRRSNMDLLKYVIHDPKVRELLSWIVFSGDFSAPAGDQVRHESAWRQKLRRLIMAMNQ